MMLGKIKNVLQPMIIKRLRIRAERDELHATLSAEAAELAGWIEQIATWHPALKATTIENNIRDEYRTLKTRSTPTK